MSDLLNVQQGLNFFAKCKLPCHYIVVFLIVVKMMYHKAIKIYPNNFILRWKKKRSQSFRCTEQENQIWRFSEPLKT